MTLGTNEKMKVGLLAGLILLMGYVVYTNVLSGPDVPPSSSAAAPAANPAAPPPEGMPGPRTAPRSRARSDEFHPTIGRKRDEKPIDPTTIDPTLRTNLLAKVQAVEIAGGSRNLFQFSAPPAKVELPKGDEPKVAVFRKVGPEPPPPPPAPQPKPVDPPPPPIPLKYYAYWVSRDNGKRTACFLDNEEILMAGEGETVKRRYRVIRINPSSVVMEDLDYKGKQQTLELTPEVQGL